MYDMTPLQGIQYINHVFNVPNDNGNNSVDNGNVSDDDDNNSGDNLAMCWMITQV